MKNRFLPLLFVTALPLLILLLFANSALAQNPPQFAPFASVHAVIWGDTIEFAIIAQDQDAADILTITKDGPGELVTIPHVSPDTGFYSWNTGLADTSGIYFVRFYVNDGTGYADTASAKMTVTIPDTVEVECLEHVDAPSKVTVDVRLWTDEALGAYDIILRWDSPFNQDIWLDSVSHSAFWWAHKPNFLQQDSIDNVKDKVGIAGIYYPGELPVTDDTIFATLHFTIGATWDTSIGVVIDSTWINEVRHQISLIDVNSDACPYEFIPGCLGTGLPPENFPPEFTQVPGTQEVTAGETVEFIVVADDPNSEDSLTIILKGKGTLTTVKHPPPDTGFFQWITADPDSEDSPYTDTFIVDDGKGMADTAFVQIIVNPFVHNPKLTVPGPRTVVAGDTVEFIVLATDPDPGDILTITKDGPGDLTTVPHPTPDTGFYRWETTADDTLGSPYTIIFYVDDGTGFSDTEGVFIDVIPYIPPPREGDLNRDGTVDVVDVVYAVNYLFEDGPPPDPPPAGDVDGDCYTTLADIVYLINYVFKLGPAPKKFSLPGDADYDGYVNVPDIVYLIQYIALQGPEPPNLKSADVDSSCEVDLVDIVYMVSYLFRGGPKPKCGCAGGDGLMTAPSMFPREIAYVEFAEPVYDSRRNVVEVPVAARFDIPLAGVQFLVQYDQFRFEPLEPLLADRTSRLSLFSSYKFGSQSIGILDLEGKNLIQPGEGDLLILRFKPLTDDLDLSGIRVIESIFVDEEALSLEVQMDQGLERPQLK